MPTKSYFNFDDVVHGYIPRFGICPTCHSIVMKDFITESESDTVIRPIKIIRNGPATIVFWNDGTKTIVRLEGGTPDDAYAAFTAAYTKKMIGWSNTKLKKVLSNITIDHNERDAKAKELEDLKNEFIDKYDKWREEEFDNLRDKMLGRDVSEGSTKED